MNKQIPPSRGTAHGAASAEGSAAIALSLQRCAECGAWQYPSRELCSNCLSDKLLWQAADPRSIYLAGVLLQHSLEDYFLQDLPWHIAAVRLTGELTAISHCAGTDIDPGTELWTFSHPDLSGAGVLISVPRSTPIETAEQRSAIVREMGLLEDS
ncbi:MAG: zinc ribbon domain-containing protein [Pseudomonadota bacterium]